MINSNSFPNKLCEDCFTELVMFAKFREKCGMSAAALDQLRRQITKLEQNGKIHMEISHFGGIKECEQNSNSVTFYENIEYAEENVEYVIYDANADVIDVTDANEKTQDILPPSENDCEKIICVRRMVISEGNVIHFIIYFSQ